MKLSWLFLTFVCCSCFKISFLNCYFSTDFEVHRNWLAITHELPFTQWYTEATSEWTLDYPPLFAVFEKFLSLFAPLFDSEMLKIHNLDYRSPATILFQRLTVILSDITLFLSIHWLLEHLASSSSESPAVHRGALKVLKDPFGRLCLLVFFFLNPGLVIVDNIHFQYNGFLIGVFLLSVLNAIKKGRHLLAAFVFSTALCLKHVFLYTAPAFVVYLLRAYCFTPQGSFKVSRLVKLSAVTLVPILLSFGPFILKGQLLVVLHRMFPFGRGLVHAYWAPNAWAIYFAADRVLKMLGVQLSSSATSVGSGGGVTGGLVGVDPSTAHLVLPRVTPIVSLGCVGVALIVPLWLIWRKSQQPSQRSNHSFLLLSSLCTLSFFLFGWHVHEKASLMTAIPLSFQILESRDSLRLFFFFSSFQTYSLFPLIFTPQETSAKCLLLLTHCVALLCLEKWMYGDIQKEEIEKRSRLREWIETKLPWAIVPLLELNYWWSPVIPRLSSLPFLRLMLISVACSLAVFYFWTFKLRSLLFVEKKKKVV